MDIKFITDLHNPKPLYFLVSLSLIALLLLGLSLIMSPLISVYWGQRELEEVKKDGYAINNITNPSEAVQLAAVDQNGYVIGYISNPSEKVQLAVVKQHGYAI